jgi:hypothetical protein
MIELFVVISLALAALLLLFWLLRPQGQADVPVTFPSTINQGFEGLLPRHYRYFPQIRHALSGADDKYLREKVSPQLAQKVRRERRIVAKQFLAGLGEDFMNLDRLARMIASLSPVISREQETERFILSLKFRLLYAWVWLRLSAGNASLPQFEHLTGIVGQLAARMEQAMAAVGALSAQGLNQGINA